MINVKVYKYIFQRTHIIYKEPTVDTGLLIFFYSSYEDRLSS